MISRKVILLADPAAEYIHEPEVELPRPDLTWQGTHDDGNKLRLLAMFGGDVHYLTDLKEWALWDGRHWKIDTNGEVWHWAGQGMQEFYLQAGDSFNKPLIH